MSRAETGLATRPTLIVEELILKEYCLLLRFTGEGLQLIVSVHRVQTANLQPIRASTVSGFCRKNAVDYTPE
jgi:hypothetical protein